MHYYTAEATSGYRMLLKLFRMTLYFKPLSTLSCNKKLSKA